MAKTTIEIADGLLIKTKKLAAELRRPVRIIVETALRNYLRAIRHPQPTMPARKPLRYKTVDGGLPKDLDVSSRAHLYDWIEKHRK